MALRDLAGINVLQDALAETNSHLTAVLRELHGTNSHLTAVLRELQETNSHLTGVLRELQETNGQRLDQVVKELRGLHDKLDRLGAQE